MPNLLREILKNEFVIDEPRERVILPEIRQSRLEHAQKPMEEADLFTQVSEMLLEQERLERVAEELRNQEGKVKEEQLTRFFRMALSVLDGFERLEQMSRDFPPSVEVRNWLRSVFAIHSRFSRLCESFGLQTMDPVGKPVDLDRHEVVEVVRTDSLPDETVVEVRQKGYTFQGRILRDASVVVAKN